MLYKLCRHVHVHHKEVFHKTVIDMYVSTATFYWKLKWLQFINNGIEPENNNSLTIKKDQSIQIIIYM